ncbi:Cobalt transport protein CbiQ [Corynebacterium kutscheri]|uniref:energy-coupling factor transporter transmembrane component T family protein n=1 Tax=Corynebacterium kutscheri TaxID=35755 RepID=UPI000F710E1D|nr:energy-coupling factor transporter transmembrane component T [Corynebacterium kutscheri]VEH80147.1 Cobalt transport protein CbiQ [Corynebacterium kutscheri]
MNLIYDINPVTRIIALALYTTPLLISVDIVSALVSLISTLFFAPLLGVKWPLLFRRGAPILIAAPISGLSMALYGRPEGKEYFSFLFAHVTDNSLALAAAIMVRVLAIGLPVIILLADIDPTELGDGLAQKLKLPSRFVIGAVAGARLVSLFRRDWDFLTRARRARGLADDGLIRSTMTMTFSLLVLALRRGAKLATAMEARGFGRDQPRTWARESVWGIKDILVLIVCITCSTVALIVALKTGYLRVLGA